MLEVAGAALSAALSAIGPDAAKKFLDVLEQRQPALDLSPFRDAALEQDDARADAERRLAK